MIRTYLDAGVLIVAVRRNLDEAERVLRLMADPEREFVSSAFVQLEVLPKALYHRNAEEVAFYGGFFGRVTVWAEPILALVERAELEGALHGLNALDALHVAAATVLEADELVTTEGVRKPIHRATSVKVISI